MNNISYRFVAGHLDEARKLVAEYHYSHREKSCPLAVGVLQAYGPDTPPVSVAACVFTPSMGKWSVPVAELQRLVRHPDYRPPLTMLISRTVKELKKRPDCPAVAVSYADWTQNHHGGVYQASSWNYSCQRAASNDGLIINDVFVPGRSCNARFGTRSADQLMLLHPDWKIEKHYDLGKHLYWIPLRKDGERIAADLGLQKNPYPKPKPCVSSDPATRSPHQVGEVGAAPNLTLTEETI